jgi:hypothetical protein
VAKAQHGSSFGDANLIGLRPGDYNTATRYSFYLGDEQELQLFLSSARTTSTKPVSATQRDQPQPQSTGNFDFMEDAGKGGPWRTCLKDTPPARPGSGRENTKNKDAAAADTTAARQAMGRTP